MTKKHIQKTITLPILMGFSNNAIWLNENEIAKNNNNAIEKEIYTIFPNLVFNLPEFNCLSLIFKWA